MILSLLVGVEAVQAANAARPRATTPGQRSAYAEAGSNDPCTVNSILQAEAADTAVPLARLLNRTRSQAKASKTADTADRAGTPLLDAGQNSSLSKDLWSSRVSAPQISQDAETSLALKRLIRQVRSVKFGEKEAGPTFTAPAEPQPTFQTRETQPVRESMAGPTPSAAMITATNVATTASEPVTPLSTQARKTLEMLQQNPGQVREPLEMAELLFLSGRPAEAAPFYAKALNQITRIDPSYDTDRAWVLFQLGNCLRETDTAKAQETYMKLVSEYPESPWTELAKAHGRLLTWYQKDRPGQPATPPQL
jgi:tetratricopeptide (TPR) repeat protein